MKILFKDNGEVTQFRDSPLTHETIRCIYKEDLNGSLMCHLFLT